MQPGHLNVRKTRGFPPPPHDRFGYMIGKTLSFVKTSYAFKEVAITLTFFITLVQGI